MWKEISWAPRFTSLQGFSGFYVLIHCKTSLYISVSIENELLWRSSQTHTQIKTDWSHVRSREHFIKKWGGSHEKIGTHELCCFLFGPLKAHLRGEKQSQKHVLIAGQVVKKESRWTPRKKKKLLSMLSLEKEKYAILVQHLNVKIICTAQLPFRWRITSTPNNIYPKSTHTLFRLQHVAALFSVLKELYFFLLCMFLAFWTETLVYRALIQAASRSFKLQSPFPLNSIAHKPYGAAVLFESGAKWVLPMKPTSHAEQQCKSNHQKSCSLCT